MKILLLISLEKKGIAQTNVATCSRFPWALRFRSQRKYVFGLRTEQPLPATAPKHHCTSPCMPNWHRNDENTRPKRNDENTVVQGEKLNNGTNIWMFFSPKSIYTRPFTLVAWRHAGPSLSYNTHYLCQYDALPTGRRQELFLLLLFWSLEDSMG